MGLLLWIAHRWLRDCELEVMRTLGWGVCGAGEQACGVGLVGEGKHVAQAAHFVGHVEHGIGVVCQRGRVLVDRTGLVRLRRNERAEPTGQQAGGRAARTKPAP